MTEAVREFWNQQAITHGADDRATNPDRYYRHLEVQEIIKRLPETGTILDIGCGNGWSTAAFKRARVNCHFIGVDYAPEMIAAARMHYPEIEWHYGDICNIRDMAKFTDVDCIVSTRCLINLATWEEQKRALWGLHDCLAPNGCIILAENCIEGLHNLNRIRAEYGLDEIKQRWHNRYLEQRELETACCNLFTIETIENIGTPYYLVSRVIHAAIAKSENREPQYESQINELAAMLPVLGKYDYSPNYLFVLRKI